MFKHVHQNHRIVGPAFERLPLNRPAKNGHPEYRASELRYPRAEFQARGVEPRPTQQTHEGPVGGSDLNRSRRWKLVPQERTQPVNASVVKVRTGAFCNRRQPEIVNLVLLEVRSAVKPVIVVSDQQLVGGGHDSRHQRLAALAPEVRRREMVEFRIAAPAAGSHFMQGASTLPCPQAGIAQAVCRARWQRRDCASPSGDRGPRSRF